MHLPFKAAVIDGIHPSETSVINITYSDRYCDGQTLELCAS